MSERTREKSEAPDYEKNTTAGQYERAMREITRAQDVGAATFGLVRAMER